MACRVAKNRHGTLALSLHWAGMRSWEGTGLPDTKANRERLRLLATAISAEMRARGFTQERYLYYFPNGNRATQFGRVATEAAPAVPSVREHFEDWIVRQVPPLVRPALTRDYRLHLAHYVLPATLKDGRTVGELALADVRASVWFQLRDRLSAAELKPKSIKNILASFRSLMRDARERFDNVVTDPPMMKWPRLPYPKADPFTPEERDRIIEWYREHKPHYYPFVLTLFYTGLRPSEATALRRGDIDLDRGIISVTRSRYYGSENAPKTRGSERTVYLLPIVRDTLRAAMPLRVNAPDAYVFTSQTTGAPIDQGKWARDFWHRPLRVLGIRPRKFYATRHTFISVALTAGVNIKWLAEQCGNSVAMIEKHYGRFLAGDAERQLQLLMAGDPTASAPRKVAEGGPQPPQSSRNRQPLTQGLRFRSKKPCGIKHRQRDRDPFGLGPGRAALDAARTLVLSPFRLRDHAVARNGPRRDELVAALADVIVAVHTRAGGEIERICFAALDRGQCVLSWQGENPGLVAAGAVAIDDSHLGDLRAFLTVVG